MNRNFFIILSALAAFLLYANTFIAPFIYDDTTYVQQNYQVKDWKYLGEIFTTSYPPHSEKNALYRPITSFSYLINFLVFGDAPKSFHVVNAILHALCCVFVFLIACNFFKDKILPFIVAILFALHPVHTEAVTWIVGRAEVLAGLFFMISFWSYLKYRYELKNTNQIYFVGSIIAYFLAMGAKEIAVTLPAVLILTDISFNKETPAWKTLKENIKYYAAFGAALVLYALLRINALSRVDPVQSKQYFGEFNFAETMIAMGHAFVAYLRLLFLPIQLQIEYPFEVPDSFFSISYIWPFLVMLVFLGVAIYYYFKTRSLLWYSVLLFPLLLFPVSNVIPMGAFMAERFLYVPSFAFCMFLAILFQLLLDKKPQLKTTGIGALLFVGALYAFKTFERNKIWQDEESFYKAGLEHAPYHATLHNNLGRVYTEKGDFNAAALQFKLSLDIDSNNAMALSNFGIIIAMKNIKGDPRIYQESERLFKKSIENDPTYYKAYTNLGTLYQNTGNKELAKIYYMKCLEFHPGDETAMKGLQMIENSR